MTRAIAAGINTERPTNSKAGIRKAQAVRLLAEVEGIS